MRILVFFLFVAAYSGTSKGSVIVSNQQRIVGGNLTTIDRYPSAVAVLYYHCFSHLYIHDCGGVIINKQVVVTAAHCISDHVPDYYWTVRAGSSYKNSGGAFHVGSKKIVHPEYNSRTIQNDISILFLATEFEFNDFISPASLAPSNYNLADNEAVWAVGWGIYNRTTGAASEQLREVEVYTINFELCRDRYRERKNLVDQNMLCTGLLDIGGKDQCNGDSGGPVYHNKVVVGLCSWGNVCGSPHFPGVNVRVSSYSEWVYANV